MARANCVPFLKFNFSTLWSVGRMSAFGQMVDIGDWRNVRVPASMRRGRSPPQSPAPGFGEKYCSLSGLPSHSLESAGGAFLTVIVGQIFAYFAFSDSHSSSPGS